MLAVVVWERVVALGAIVVEAVPLGLEDSDDENEGEEVEGDGVVVTVVPAAVD
jgi:hypothetical protein